MPIDDDTTPVKLENAEEIHKIALQMQKIEAKMNALLKSAGKDVNDFNALHEMTSKDKLKCFFKMFVSSTGRKTNGKNPLLTGVED